MLKYHHLVHFLVDKKKERIGRNPKTGIEAPIIARKVVTFKTFANYER